MPMVIMHCKLVLEAKKQNTFSKAERGHFAKSKVEPKEKIAEFKVS